MASPVQYLSSEIICGEADHFLSQYNPEGEIPVPIEEIIEFGLRMEIIPFRGLQDRFNIAGFLSTDLTTITVDEETLERNPRRYRYTLAHEIGHKVLHADYIEAFRPMNAEDWKETIKAIPSKDYSRLEFQAYEFAGCVLVPRAPLLAAWEEAATLADRHGLDLAEMGDAGIEQVAGWIAKQFQVSTAVIKHRLKREGLTGE